VTRRLPIATRGRAAETGVTCSRAPARVPERQARTWATCSRPPAAAGLVPGCTARVREIRARWRETADRGSDPASHHPAGHQVSRCTRSQGISGFPDPQVSGSGGSFAVTIRIRAGQGSNPNLNPDSPQFQAARKACRSLMPVERVSFVHRSARATGPGAVRLSTTHARP
jgi:hypothetical protein